MALVAGCSLFSKPAAKKAPPPPPPSIETTEALAHDAEHHINAAEAALGNLQPDQAVEHLNKAEQSFQNAKFDAYPDAELIRTRHLELFKKVPGVREEIRRRELAAAVKAAKEEIGLARANLQESVKRIRRRKPDDADLEYAAEAVTKLSEAIEKSNNLESKDRDYSKFALGVRKVLSKQRKVVEARQLDVALAKSREAITLAQKELGDVLGRLRRQDVVDGEFDEARKIAGGVEKAIDDGTELIAKDRRYAKFVSSAKKRLASQKEAIDKRHHDVKVARQRTRVEDARKALAAALSRLKADSVVEADFAEATAAVERAAKVLKEGDDLAVKDRGYYKYASSVAKRLEEGKKRIKARKLELAVANQRRAVAEASSELKASLNRLRTHLVEDVDFKAAEAAVASLEKRLEDGSQYALKDRAYSKFAMDARREAAGAHKTIRERRESLAVDRQRAKVEAKLEGMRGALQLLKAFSPTPEQFEAAREAAKQVTEALDAGGALEKKSGDYARFAIKVRKSVGTSLAKIEKRRTEVTARERRMLVEDSLAAFKVAAQGAQSIAASSENVKEAEAGLAAVRDELQKGEPIEERDAGYAKFAKATRKTLDRLARDLEEAKRTIAFRTGPLIAFGDASDLVQGAASMGPEERTQAYAEALEKYRACQKDGAAILADFPRLASSTFTVGGRKMKARKVLTACGSRAKAAEDKLSASEAVLAVHQGPIKSIESGRALLHDAGGTTDKSKQKDVLTRALSEFDACVEKGKMIEYKHPKLKKKKFELESGRKMSLSGMVGACKKHATATRRAIAEAEGPSS